jgi:hypothetical protein
MQKNLDVLMFVDKNSKLSLSAEAIEEGKRIGIIEGMTTSTNDEERAPMPMREAVKSLGKVDLTRYKI